MVLKINKNFYLFPKQSAYLLVFKLAVSFIGSYRLKTTLRSFHHNKNYYFLKKITFLKCPFILVLNYNTMDFATLAWMAVFFTEQELPINLVVFLLNSSKIIE